MRNTLSGSGVLEQNGSSVGILTGEGSSVGSLAINEGELAFAQQGNFSVIGDATTQSDATMAIKGLARLDVGGQFNMDGSLNIIADGSNGVSQPIISADRAVLGSESSFTLSGFSLPSSSLSDPVNMGRATFHVIGTSSPGHISGDFSTISMGGATSPVDYITFTSNVDLQQQNYNIGLALTWYDGYTSTPENAHGTFTLSGQREFFDLGVMLLDVAANDAAEWDGKSLTKAGLGTLLLSKQNQYTGGTLIQGGILQLEAENAIAASGGVRIDEGAALVTGDADQLVRQLSGAGRIVLGQSELTQHNAGGTTLFSGQISGLGGLRKTGDGTLILSGDSHFAGITTIAEGVLQLGNGGTKGSVVGHIVNDAMLVFDRSDDLVYGGVVSGRGHMTQAEAAG